MATSRAGHWLDYTETLAAKGSIARNQAGFYFKGANQMNRYALKLSAAVLAGLMVSSAALAEDEKIFVCKLTDVEYMNGSPSKSIDETVEYKFQSFRTEGQDEYKSQVNAGIAGRFEVLVTINRKTGGLWETAGDMDKPTSYVIKKGSCDLVVRKIKLKF